MGIKTYRPHTPGLRQRASITFEELTADRPNKKLTKGSGFKAGRGAHGRISVRRKGGRHKRRYRQIDFRRDKIGIPGKVASIEYDPNRSANIALIIYRDGERRYILAPKDLQVGDQLLSLGGEAVDGPASLRRAMGRQRWGDSVEVELRREEENRTVAVLLRRTPENETIAQD